MTTLRYSSPNRITINTSDGEKLYFPYTILYDKCETIRNIYKYKEDTDTEYKEDKSHEINLPYPAKMIDDF